MWITARLLIDCGSIRRTELRWERGAFVRVESRLDWARTQDAPWCHPQTSSKLINTCTLLQSPNRHLGHDARVDEERHSAGEGTRATKTLDCLDSCEINKINLFVRRNRMNWFFISRAQHCKSPSVRVGLHEAAQKITNFQHADRILLDFHQRSESSRVIRLKPIDASIDDCCIRFHYVAYNPNYTFPINWTLP